MLESQPAANAMNAQVIRRRRSLEDRPSEALVADGAREGLLRFCLTDIGHREGAQGCGRGRC